MLLRRDKLCEGGPRKCTEARTVTCRECGDPWTPQDIGTPGACPSCASGKYLRDRCPGCEVTKLEESMTTPAGNLLTIASQYDTMLEKKFTITPDDIDAEIFAALQAIWSERAKYTAEEARKPRG